MRASLLWALSALACASAPGRPPAEADLVLRGGKVFVAAGELSTAVAIRGDRVAALGEDRKSVV